MTGPINVVSESCHATPKPIVIAFHPKALEGVRLRLTN